MKKFRRTKLPKFRLVVENFVRRKFFSAEILSDKVFPELIKMMVRLVRMFWKDYGMECLGGAYSLTKSYAGGGLYILCLKKRDTQ